MDSIVLSRRRLAAIPHALAAAFFLVQGVGHEIAVAYRAQANAIRSSATRGELLAVGAGLIVVGLAMALTVAPLARGSRRAHALALGSIALLAALVVAIASRFGFMFLGGSIAVGVIDLAAIVFAATGSAARPH